MLLQEFYAGVLPKTEYYKFISFFKFTPVFNFFGLFKHILVINLFIGVPILLCSLLVSCDEGFEGSDCQPATQLKDSIQADFGIRYEPDTDFEHIRGGKVVHSNQGCGNIFADESLYFYDVS